MALVRGVRCIEEGCNNYCEDEGTRGPSKLCKICRDEALLDKLHSSRTGTGNISWTDKAREKREREENECLERMGRAQVGLIPALNILKEWQREA